MSEHTVFDSTAVQGAGRCPALPDAMEGAVAQVSAHRAHPLVVRHHDLIQILSIPHEQAVPTEYTLHSTGGFVRVQPWTRILPSTDTCASVLTPIWNIAVSL